jgi:diguanylate cyclase (GGDEF)-like protein/PAS domain S-box-containing protein
MISRKVPSTYQHRQQRASHFAGRLPLFVEYFLSLLMLIGIGGLLLWGLTWQRDFILADRHQTQATLAQVAEAQLVSTLRAARDVLEELSDMSQENGPSAPARQARIWQNERKVLPEAALMLIADENGRITAASRPGIIGHSVVDADFFILPRNTPGTGELFVSPPSRAFGQQRVIVLSREIQDANGRFRGIAALTLTDESLEKMLSGFRVKPSQAINLVHESGSIIARNPRLLSYDETPLTGKDTLFSKHLASGRPLTSLLADSGIDGQKKVGTALSINAGSIHLNKALVVTVVENADEVLAPWKRMANLLWAYVLLALLAIWYGAASYRRRRDNENARVFIDTLLANPDLIVVGLRGDGSIALFNTAASNITEYSQQNVIGQNWFDLLIPEAERPLVRTNFARTLNQPNTPTPFETRLRTADGDERVIAWRTAVIKDKRRPLVILIGADITLVRKREEELQTQAQMDALTEVANRRHFLDMGNRALAQARRHRYPLTVLMLDIDHFKQVNDTYGHQVGDRVLRTFAQLCRQSLREEDLLGRIGGEEFAIILPHADIEAACANARRIRERFASTIIRLADAVQFSCSVSIGISDLNPPHLSLDELLQQADLALYQAKHEGRNRVVTYTQPAELPPQQNPPP